MATIEDVKVSVGDKLGDSAVIWEKSGRSKQIAYTDAEHLLKKPNHKTFSNAITCPRTGCIKADRLIVSFSK